MGKLVFVWDNFGPLHADRCNAVAKKFEGREQVIGLELAGRSRVYDWLPENGTHFRKVTLVTGCTLEEIPFAQRFGKTLNACLTMGRGSRYFMGHYQDPAIFLESPRHRRALLFAIAISPSWQGWLQKRTYRWRSRQ